MLTILCSGQGQQHRAMFDLVRDDPEAAELFDTAAKLLSRDPRDLVRSAATEELEINRTAQILCVLQGLTLWRALRKSVPSRWMVAGYSVGEVAAWSVGGLCAPVDTLHLVAARAEAMDASRRGAQGLLFVRGLTREVVDSICQKARAHVAIVNPGNAFVIGGRVDALSAVAKAASVRHASRVTPIGVHVAAHTPCLAAAVEPFREKLLAATIGDRPMSATRLYSGIDGSPVLDVPKGLDKLARQVAVTVQWADCLQACTEAGSEWFLELGPGRALVDMAASTYPAVRVRSADDFRTLGGLRAWLQESGE